MGRSIVTARKPKGQSAFPDVVQDRGCAYGAAEEKPDGYKERLFKYIPGEVVALYLGLVAVVRAASDAPPLLEWLIFIVGVVATPYYMYTSQKVRSRFQLAISTAAFAVWVFALGGPFAQLGWYQPVYGGLLLPIFTFFIAGVPPVDDSPGG